MRLLRSLPFLTLVLPAVGLSQAKLPPQSPSVGREIRNLGMGNVGVALPGDRASPFYNPAGLNDLTEWNLTILGLATEFAAGSTSMFRELSDLNDDIKNVPDGPSADAEKTAYLDEFLQKHAGQFHFFRASVELARYVRRNFAAGLIVDEKMDISFRDRSFAHFDIRSFGDVTPFVSGAYGWKDGLLQFGVTVKPTIRFSLDEEDQQVSYDDVVENRLSDQFGRLKDPRFSIGADLGFKSNLNLFGFGETRFYKWLRPSFGLTWQDLGSPGFGSAEGNRQSVSVGTAVHPDFWRFKNTFAVDFRDLNWDRSFISKVNVGLEMKSPWFVSLRLGMNQGYFAVGGGLRVPYVRLDVAYYGQEVGVHTYEASSPRLAFFLGFDV